MRETTNTAATFNQRDCFPFQRDFLNDGYRRKKMFALHSTRTSTWKNSLFKLLSGPCIFWHGLFISIRLVFTVSRGFHLLPLLYWNIFRIVLHKRSLFPSQLALIENTNFFTLFRDTNCSYCLERTEKETYLTPFWSQIEAKTAPANVMGA